MYTEPDYRLKVRRTRIVATLGPASSTREVIRELLRVGVDVARLNFSHGTHADHGRIIALVREVAAELGRPVGLLGDLCGPKIRVGMFEGGGIELQPGSELQVVTDDVLGRPGLVPSQYEHLARDVEPGQRILLDDGRLVLEVLARETTSRLRCRVVRGGLLKDKKGMNLPGASLSTPALTAKDQEDLAFCLEQDLDYVALSFVRWPDEVEDLQARIRRAGEGRKGALTRVVAKIEKPEALENIERIVELADGIMVARGDLGVEMPPEKVPILQNQLIALANQRQKPVIVATQMLESMTEQASPTRAEVSDLATAVFGNADAVMLSAESASGKFPVESVQVMDTVLREIESYQWSQHRFGKLRDEFSVHPNPNALARACTLLCKDMEIRAVNVMTRSGRTARIMSAARPGAPVLAFCHDPKVARQLMLCWGVQPVAAAGELSADALADQAARLARERGLAGPGQYVLLVSNFRSDQDSNAVIAYKLP
ncbi:MAG TPA: pyruvate kinase [Myxococcota bacterium]|nr:pyruvate kinase [Myxococcota bacterium]HRY92880.1 pyruvate kinase [Myxococcota bacterium]HSA22564.1 pyruvate kinase [Myxococcota bacterium]